MKNIFYIIKIVLSIILIIPTLVLIMIFAIFDRFLHCYYVKILWIVHISILKIISILHEQLMFLFELKMTRWGELYYLDKSEIHLNINRNNREIFYKLKTPQCRQKHLLTSIKENLSVFQCDELTVKTHHFMFETVKKNDPKVITDEAFKNNKSVSRIELKPKFLRIRLFQYILFELPHKDLKEIYSQKYHARTRSFTEYLYTINLKSI